MPRWLCGCVWSPKARERERLRVAERGKRWVRKPGELGGMENGRRVSGFLGGEEKGEFGGGSTRRWGGRVFWSFGLFFGGLKLVRLENLWER